MPDPTDALPPYPPPRHAMRMVALEAARDVDGDVRGWLPVTPGLATPSGGPRAAAVAMAVDALGGLRSILAAEPDWAFTADMSLHLLPTGPVTELAAEVHVRRRGRRTMVVEVDLTADDGIPAGLATLSFAVVARPSHVAAPPAMDLGPRAPLSGLEPGEVAPDDYLSAIGVVVEEPGVTVIDLVPEVCNTVGALHGAVHAAMVDEAGASLGRHLLGPSAETADLHLAFLELGRSGPLRAVATPVGDPGGTDRLTAEVRLLDAEGRTCSYATIGVIAP